MKYTITRLLLWTMMPASTNSFTTAPLTSSRRTKVASSFRLHASGKGFGKSSERSSSGKGFGNNNQETNKSSPSDRTYGQVPTIQDVIDTEAAMSAFFSSNEEWHPLFHSFATSAAVPAMSFLAAPSSIQVEFDINNIPVEAPWRRLEGIPQQESQKQVLATVLDSMHASLIDIPVDEKTKEDENDLHFLEEGRRMLAITRFHVLEGVQGGCMDSYDTLFSTCWSELMELRSINEASTGSLIVVPDYDITDLKRFTDINLLRPLEWLGLEADFEVTSLHRGSPAIRLLHKLQDMPTEPWNDEESDEGTGGGAGGL